ncbi:uncharacterized protein SCHCODRAFT_02644407 [Schizophyllum commune H4-8]|uniref:uncharacterized protein n=1 Tax=Schizophyllum commune (strain H4-8 / FGSC 9210) TaxID=578458 RepID=UPI002160C69D|nr:uncharacterized protein SCHCODRAFT_02644407 [Schizophyllum commune H4-8]KAI5885310.1 hypothetical protein SCHCODRAFT_02644407 [Schizophyllum commune H4-8]
MSICIAVRRARGSATYLSCDPFADLLSSPLPSRDAPRAPRQPLLSRFHRLQHVTSARSRYSRERFDFCTRSSPSTSNAGSRLSNGTLSSAVPPSHPFRCSEAAWALSVTACSLTFAPLRGGQGCASPS